MRELNTVASSSGSVYGLIIPRIKDEGHVNMAICLQLSIILSGNQV